MAASSTWTEEELEVANILADFQSIHDEQIRSGFFVPSASNQPKARHGKKKGSSHKKKRASPARHRQPEHNSGAARSNVKPIIKVSAPQEDVDQQMIDVIKQEMWEDQDGQVQWGEPMIQIKMEPEEAMEQDEQEEEEQEAEPSGSQCNGTRREKEVKVEAADDY